MDFFAFNFKVGDTFEHKYKAIEKYINKNITEKIKIEWKPRIIIQVFQNRTTVLLEKDLSNLNRVHNQTLLIKVFDGATLLKHVSLSLEYQGDDEGIWLVTYVNHDPLAGWR